MASSFATTASSPSPSSSPFLTKAASNLPLSYYTHSPSNLSFRLPPKPNLRFFTKGSHPHLVSSAVVKAQLKEVSVDGSSNAAASSTSNSEVPSAEEKHIKLSNDPSSGDSVTEESISEFITQVASLVKLVDSRDIVELQLKQLGCEVIIRKREALPQQPSPTPVAMIHSPPPPVAAPAPTTAPTSAPPPPASSTSPPAVKSSKSSHPPLKCPMTGTFYRSPAPGEPAFVKVGDKVQKGQVLCIIEAMKLMNEIEADQSGTIVDILAEDGKPVSVDTPLFVIEP